MSTTALEIRPILVSEMPMVARLLADVFASTDEAYYRYLYQLHGSRVAQRSGFEQDTYRGAFLGGNLVAVARVEKHTLRYGMVQLKVAGIGDICTHPDYRRRGYSAVVVRDALAYATEAGAHLVLLRDPGDYYRRYGFSSVLPDYYLHYHSEDVLTLSRPERVHLRLAHFNDLSQLEYLYDNHWSGRVAFVRSPDLWEWRLEDPEAKTLVACDADGRLEGYLWRHPFDATQIELLASSPEAMIALMQVVAQQSGQETIALAVPPDDTIVAYSRLLMPVSLSATYHPRSGWMARAVNVRRLMRTLLPELKNHLESIAYLSEDISPTLEARPETIAVGFRNAPEMQCELIQRDFIQIMFGTLRPAMLAQRSPLRRDQVRLLEMLFPPRMAALAPWDWF